MHSLLDSFFSAAGRIVLGKPAQIKLAMCCLLARGHLLIEDVPGVGKTTLAHSLAHLLGLQYQRVQFTSDLLPADILGSTVFDAAKQTFTFHPGAVFSQVLLADEINRATPKSQSALLEAMEEKQVTVERCTYPLPTPFFVIATQNPLSQIGTFPLPESQLDRFLMCIGLGFPDQSAERALLKGEDRRSLLRHTPPCMGPEQLTGLQEAAAAIHVSDALLDYLQALISYTRHSGEYEYGLSPRAGLALLAAARAWAFLEKRDMVLPEDLQTLLPAVAGHRLRRSKGYGGSAADRVAPLLENVAIP
ncbi:AAA family ATPase [Methylogaea oryzae]|uniref:ATPase AAA n=1 Tax=Methylogaea oryzae TaxID=1295382 RepID=A0A8D5AIU6_9GAMM|nr:AAA family ATPase [Methylogaea oryzae]BBL72883.1 ATPase AAA [Methylogaea oryzae]